MSEPILPAVPVIGVESELLDGPLGPGAIRRADPIASTARRMAADTRFEAAMEQAKSTSSVNAPDDRARDPMWKAAKEFEAMMLGQMFASMFKGIKSDGMFSGGHSEEAWKGFLFEEFGKAATSSGGFGIAESVYRDIKGRGKA